MTSSLEKYLNPLGKVAHLSGSDLYKALDSGDANLDEVASIVRNRYPESARTLDKWLFHAATSGDLTANEPSESEKMVVALIGAFNRIRGMKVFRHDSSIDRENAPRIMTSPSAAMQILQHCSISPQDKVLELFSGAGYLSFFLALCKPEKLDCVDLFAATLYNLPKTFTTSVQDIYSELPSKYVPEMTQPNHITSDASALRFSESNMAEKPVYTKIFLNPPYGRETKRTHGMSEGASFALWIRSVTNIISQNGSGYEMFSVIPTEWSDALTASAKNNTSFDECIQLLCNNLADKPYYQGRGLDATIAPLPEDWHKLLGAVEQSSTSLTLRETKMFPLTLHKIVV